MQTYCDHAVAEDYWSPRTRSLLISFLSVSLLRLRDVQAVETPCLLLLSASLRRAKNDSEVCICAQRLETRTQNLACSCHGKSQPEMHGYSRANCTTSQSASTGNCHVHTETTICLAEYSDPFDASRPQPSK